MNRFTRWQYSREDPDGLSLLADLRESESWSSVNRVWQAVLWLALREAQYSDAPAGKHGWKRRAARRWIFYGGLDFRIVCHLAGVDPARFREGAGRMGINE